MRQRGFRGFHREQLRPVEQHQRSAAAGHHREDVLPVAQPIPGRGLVPGGIHLVDAERRRAQQRGGLPGAGADRDGRDVMDLEVGGVAEHHQQEDRQDDHHRHRAPVSPQFPELLDHHRPHAGLP